MFSVTTQKMGAGEGNGKSLASLAVKMGGKLATQLKTRRGSEKLTYSAPEIFNLLPGWMDGWKSFIQ